MKTRIALLLCVMLVAQLSRAQDNFSGFNYQAVVRDAQGQPLPNQAVGVQFIFSCGIAPPYMETHSTISDAHGLIALVIGEGTPGGAIPSFDAIDWNGCGAASWSLTIAMDITGGTNYVQVGVQELKAVPFALNALSTVAQPTTGWTLVGNDLHNTNSGNVGIGEPAPQSKLHVAGDLRVNNPNPGVNTNIILNNTTNGRQHYIFSEAATGNLGFESETGFKLNTSGPNTRLSIHSSGRVGIGTADPAAGYRLTVDSGAVLLGGTNGGRLMLSRAGSLGNFIDYRGGYDFADDNSLTFRSDNNGSYNSRMTLTGAGNVGIGTTTPASKLEVMGGSVLFGGTNGGRLYLSRSGAQGHYIDFRGGYDFADDNSLTFRSVNNGSFNNRMTLTGAGNVGVGTTDPMTKLDVRGKIQAVNVGNPTATNDRLELYADGIRSYIRSYGDDQGLEIESTLASKIYLKANDTYCTGKLFAREVEVTLAVFPDYVFDAEYKLMPLAEVEAFISANGHLPNVPSACEVEDNGIGLGEMNRILLEKVEELTLHAIQSDKRILELEELLMRIEANGSTQIQK